MSKGRNLAKLLVSNTGSIGSSALASVLDTAPAQLDTLKELATALNNDASFATTVNNSIAGKQATLVSGTNIKTVNGSSLLGSGNITISGSSAANNGTLGGVYGLTQDTAYSTGSNGYGNTILGYGAYASGNYQNTRYNLVGGVEAYATSSDGVSLGYGSWVKSPSSISVGASAKVQTSADSSVVVGDHAWVGQGANQSTVVGANAFTSNYKFLSTVLGYNSKSYESYNTTLGAANENHGEGTVIAGYGNNAYGRSILMGGFIYDNGYNAIVLKNNNTQFMVPGEGFYVPTMTTGTTSNVLYFDNSNGKITYGTAPSGGGSALTALSDVVVSSPQTGQVLTYMGGAWRNVTPAASGSSGGGGGAPATLSGNGFTLSNFDQYAYSFSLDSSTTAAAFNNAYTNLQTPLSAFSAQTGLYSMMVLNAVYANSYWSLGPEFNPGGLMKPTINQNGPTSFSVQTNQGFNQMSLGQFPQYSDNDNKIWFTISLGTLQYSSVTHNAQFNGPTGAKISPSSYMGGGGGQDPIPMVLTLLTELNAIDSGVHSVAIRAGGYNALSGQTTMMMFFGCTNITYQNNELTFSYATSEDYGNYPGSLIAFGIDIQ